MNELHNDKIRIDESNHRYYLIDEPQTDFVSCTTFIEYFFHKFDSVGVANNLTMSHPNYIGMTPQELVKIWENAASEGTQVHKEIDNFIKYGTIPQNSKSKIASDWIKKIDRDKYEILSEKIIYSNEIKIAGTVDLILLNRENNTIDIYDWKTSKSIDQNSYGMKMGRVPITSNLKDCNFIHYSLQLSLYRFILESYYSLKVDKLTLLHLNNNITPYQCSYMQNVIIEMLKYDRFKLAKETEDSLTKEFVNEFGFEPEPNFEDFIDPEDFGVPTPEDLLD
ncbi:MAG: hypothetical protein B6D44_06185 [Ignavibacteriales bacterium UTCHB2]|jgi:hypothetical protein|nr:MAG: PD-(D/E)XK nuclease superfamily protein [Ignavibacteria bacterium ADurb.Bin266]OQY73797.1 MAG: hypothetical protein B6D44_06185 [Ignavibacteriales bacterium UTCHB2]HQI42295.1 PD-(D/E)XK nuclease family protein [Ignavibacteriaceae bacterium]